MTDVVRFETVTDLEPGEDETTAAISARLVAVLSDGRHVAVTHGPAAAGVHATEDYDATDWDDVAACLVAQGVAGADGLLLRALPHAVVLTDALRARLSPPSSAPRSSAT
jgi:hypothetical protein